MDDRVRVAFVAYHFPPIGGGLSHRSLKYVKFLPEYGVDVKVFSSQPDDSVVWWDEGMLAEIAPSIPIVRCLDYRSTLGGRWAKVPWIVSIYRRLVRLFSHPDVFVSWSNRAFEELAKRHRETPFDVVFTTSFPWSAHRVGLRAKRELNTRWVSDFRDPWTLNYEQRSMNKLVKAVYRRMEQRVYDLSDHVIINTHGNLEDVVQYFTVERNKFTVIPNGYDPSDLILSSETERHGDGKFHLLYLGGLRGDWFEAPLYKALEQLRCTAPDAYGRLVIDFVGESAPKGELMRILGVGDVCRFHGFQPLKELGRWLALSDACLLLLPDGGSQRMGWIPQKLYTYLQSHRPILLLGPEGSAADVIRQAGAGIRLPGSQPVEVAKILRSWVLDREAGALRRGASPDRIADYDKRALTGRLADIFWQLSKPAATRKGSQRDASDPLRSAA